MDDSHTWYFARDGVQTGPVSFAQLAEAVRAGQCGPNDLVWREGMSNWQPASSVAALFDQNEAPAGKDESGETAPAFEASPQHPAPPSPYSQPGIIQLPYADPPAQGQSYNGMAIGGFVCSVTALPMMCCTAAISIPLSITGLVLGIVARRGMKRTGNLQGSGFATAAIIIGIVGLVLFGGMAIILITFAVMSK